MIQIKKVVKITHTHRNFKRYLEILHVFIKYGFGGIASMLHLDIAIKSLSRACRNKDVKTDKACIGDPIEVRMRKALEELGPTFIKLGQILSTRTDLIPAEFAKEFSKLQDSAPGFPHEEACKIIQADLGAKAVDIFDYFNSEPIAAASIGQVYKGVYRGNDVAIKVLRPNIERVIETDLEIMMHLALLLEKHIEEVAVFKPSAIVEEFAKSINREIDFKIEAKQTKRFLENIKDNRYIYAPRVYDELTTSRVMVSEFIDGESPENVDVLIAMGCDPVVLAEKSVDSILKQIFEYGFYHADPHPGNIKIMPGNIVCFLDFGMVGKVPPNLKHYFASLIMNITNKKSNRIVEILLKLTNYEVEPDKQLLERDMYDVIDEYLLHSLKDLDFGKFLSTLMDIFARHRLRLKAEIFLLLKALVSLEKTGKILAPEVNIIEKAKPYVKTIYLDRFKPERIMSSVIDPVNDLMLLAAELPDSIRVLLNNAKAGRLKLDIDYVGLDRFRKTMLVVSTRIAFAILLAALIIGHSLILSQPAANTKYYIRVIGHWGFLVTVVISIIFLLSYIRNKDKWDK